MVVVGILYIFGGPGIASMIHERLARGSKNPIFKDSGPKNHTPNGLWDQRPDMLGTWAL